MALPEAGAGTHEDGLKAVSGLVASDLGIVGVLEKLNPLSRAEGRSRGNQGSCSSGRDLMPMR